MADRACHFCRINHLPYISTATSICTFLQSSFLQLSLHLTRLTRSCNRFHSSKDPTTCEYTVSTTPVSSLALFILLQRSCQSFEQCLIEIGKFNYFLHILCNLDLAQWSMTDLIAFLAQLSAVSFTVVDSNNSVCCHGQVGVELISNFETVHLSVKSNSLS